MPFPSETYVTQIQDPAVRAEFGQQYSLFQGYLSTEHKETGAHGDVTADSLDVAGTATIDGTTTAASITLSETTSGGLGTGASGPGITIPDTTGVGNDWAIINSGDGYEESLGFYDTTNANEVLKLYSVSAGSSYTLAPSEDGLNTVKLGDHTDTDLIFDECAAAKFYERNDAGLGYWNTFTPSWTNLSVGNGTLTARYSQIGKVTLVEVFLIFGTTTSITGAVTIGSLPTNNSAVMQAQRLGEVGMFDASAGQTYSGAAFTSTATSANLLNNASPHTAVAAAVPFVWTTSDQLYVFLTYREA